MILVPVTDLQTRVQLDCGLPAYSADTNITTTAILDFVKRSAQKLSGIVQRAGAGEHYLTTDSVVSTVVGIPFVSLPTNALSLVRIAMVVSGDREVMLDSAPIDSWDPNAAGFLDNIDTVPVYRVIGNTITLFPTPQQVRDLRLYYTLGFQVTSSADVLALQPFWDEYIVANCNVLVRNRQEKACPEFLQERSEAESAVISQIKRDRASPRQVRDLQGNFFDYFYPRRGMRR